jgi:hypothetical protein
MKRRTVVAALVVLGACSSGARAPDSGIRGAAVYGPTCPVQRVGAPPCERPYSGVIVVERGGKRVASTRSDSNGSFRIPLQPGTYTVTSTTTGFPFVKPIDVVVRPHSYTTITVLFDSGMR